MGAIGGSSPPVTLAIVRARDADAARARHRGNIDRAGDPLRRPALAVPGRAPPGPTATHSVRAAHDTPMSGAPTAPGLACTDQPCRVRRSINGWSRPRRSDVLAADRDHAGGADPAFQGDR